LTASSVVELPKTYLQFMSKNPILFENARYFAVVLDYKHILYRLDETKDPKPLFEFESVVAFDT